MESLIEMISSPMSSEEDASISELLSYYKDTRTACGNEESSAVKKESTNVEESGVPKYATLDELIDYFYEGSSDSNSKHDVKYSESVTNIPSQSAICKNVSKDVQHRKRLCRAMKDITNCQSTPPKAFEKELLASSIGPKSLEDRDVSQFKENSIQNSNSTNKLKTPSRVRNNYRTQVTQNQPANFQESSEFPYSPSIRRKRSKHPGSSTHWHIKTNQVPKKHTENTQTFEELFDLVMNGENESSSLSTKKYTENTQTFEELFDLVMDRENKSSNLSTGNVFSHSKSINEKSNVNLNSFLSIDQRLEEENSTENRNRTNVDDILTRFCKSPKLCEVKQRISLTGSFEGTPSLQSMSEIEKKQYRQSDLKGAVFSLSEKPNSTLKRENVDDILARFCKSPKLCEVKQRISLTGSFEATPTLQSMSEIEKKRYRQSDSKGTVLSLSEKPNSTLKRENVDDILARFCKSPKLCQVKQKISLTEPCEAMPPLQSMSEIEKKSFRQSDSKGTVFSMSENPDSSLKRENVDDILARFCKSPKLCEVKETISLRESCGAMPSLQSMSEIEKKRYKQSDSKGTVFSVSENPISTLKRENIDDILTRFCKSPKHCEVKEKISLAEPFEATPALQSMTQKEKKPYRDSGSTGTVVSVSRNLNSIIMHDEIGEQCNRESNLTETAFSNSQPL